MYLIEHMVYAVHIYNNNRGSDCTHGLYLITIMGLVVQGD